MPVIKNLTDYGAFVDRRHRRPAAHHRHGVEARAHPSEVVEVGDELEVRVLKYDRERNRVSRLARSSWARIRGQHRPPLSGQLPHQVFGKVSNVTDYGAFVEIEPA